MFDFLNDSTCWIFIVYLFILFYIHNVDSKEISKAEVTSICKEVEKESLFKNCDLVHAIIQVESGYESNAYTSEKTGNYGLMQIQCGTAKWMLGVGKKFDCSLLFNPTINIKTGILYLAYLQEKQKISGLKDLIAAYNVGKVYTCAQFKEWHPEDRISSYPLVKQQRVREIIKNCKTYINDKYVNKVYHQFSLI